MRKPRGYWTFERCKEEALKYDSRSEFSRFSSSSYNAAYRNEWLDYLCNHMKIRNSSHCKFLYVILNNNKTKFYVGITYNLEKRLLEHRKTDKVKIFGDGFDYYWHSKLPMEVITVSLMENRLINYLTSKGIVPLNKMKGRFLGKCRKIWTFDKCLKEALEYRHRSDFYLNSRNAYIISHREGWLNKICEHMERKRKWTFDICKLESSKYKTKEAFKKSNIQCYSACKRNGWLNILFPKIKPPA